MGQGKEAKIKIGGETEAAELALKELENQGKKSLNNIKKSGDSTSKDVINSFKKLGIRSEAEIKKSTSAARKAFNDLKKSGVASANDIKRAHRQMTDKIKSNNRELQGSTSRLNKIFTSLKGTLLSFFAVAAIINLIKKMTGAALENEIQLNRLETQVENLGISFDSVKESIDETTEATAKYAQQQKGDVSKTLQDLIFVTGDLEKSQANLNLVYDLATLKGISIEESTKLIGRALSGNVETLGRYFVEFKNLNKTLGANATNQQKAAFAAAFLNEKVAGAIENITENERAVRVLKNEWASFIQASGEVIIPALNKLFLGVKSLGVGLFFALEGLLIGAKQVARFTDAVGLSSLGVDTLNEAIKIMDDKARDLAQNVRAASREGFNFERVNREVAISSKQVAKEIKEQNDSFSMQDEIISKLAETEKEQIEVEKEASKQRIDNLKIFNQSLQTSISGLRTQLGKLRSEAEASAAFTQSLQDRIQAFDREQAAKGKGERGRLKLGVEFATEDFERAKQELAAGNRQAAEDLANAAFAGFEEAAGRSDVLGRAQATQARAMLDEIVAFSSEITSQIESQAAQVQTNLQELQSVAQRIEAKIKIEVDAKDAFETISKLKQPTTSQHTIFVNTVETKQTGGQVGAIRARTGRHLPGFGGGDRIPVLAEAGEFVLRKEAVKTFGVDVISAINRMDISGLNKKLNGVNIQKFQQGGEVQASPSSNVNVNLKLAGENFKLQASKEIADNFVNKINQTNILLGRYQTPY